MSKDHEGMEIAKCHNDQYQVPKASPPENAIDELFDWCSTNNIVKIRKYLEEYDCKELIDEYAEIHDHSLLHHAVYEDRLEIVKLLLEYGVNANIMDDEDVYGTVLTWASIKERLNMINTLLDGGVDIDFTDSNGNTALQRACAYGMIEVVKLLISRGANVFHRNEKGETLLMEASKSGNIDIMTYLLSHDVDIHVKDHDKKTALHHVFTYEYKATYNAVQLLLSHGAYFNVRNIYGHTPLIYACILGHLDIVQLLIENGADLHVRNNQNHTALVGACLRGYTEVVQYLLPLSQPDDIMNMHPGVFIEVCKNGYVDILQALLDAGLPMNPSYSVTALNEAIVFGKFEVVKLLIDDLKTTTTNVNIIDSYDCSPLMYACGWYRPPHSNIQPNIDIVMLLLRKGADVRYINKKNGKSAMNIACTRGYVDIVKLLVEYGAEIDVNNTMIAAAYEGYTDLVRYCLEKGAQVDYRINKGKTVFQNACENKCINMIQIVLDYGTDINQIDDVKSTKLIYACCRGHNDVVQLLINRGANINVINRYNMSALFWVCHKSTINLILLRTILSTPTVNINITNKGGVTPLIYASAEGLIDIVKLLIEYGADINIKCKEKKKSAIQYAKDFGHVEVEEILLKAGATDTV